MELMDDQLLKIEKYLDLKKLTHLDLRYEVLDHIANGIENSMIHKNLDFNDAFKQEAKKWNHELASYSSSWLGRAYHGPKIMMRKCEKKMKKVYLKASITALVLATFLYALFSVFDVEIYNALIKNVLGTCYLGVLGVMLYFHFKIKKSGFESSYSYLFRMQTTGTGFVFLVFNPLWADLNLFQGDDTVVVSILFMHSFFIAFSYIFWTLYKDHMSFKKFKLA